MFFENVLKESMGVVYAALSLAALAYVISRSDRTVQLAEGLSNSLSNIIGAATLQNSQGIY